MNAVRLLAEKAARRHELDLVGFLNEASATQLDAMCRRVGVKPGTPGAMRQRLWAWGAAAERAPLLEEPPPHVQPTPVLRGGRLQLRRRSGAAGGAGDVLPVARRARFPAAASWPRPLPVDRDPPAATPPPPATLDELLARADALVGVRLGARGRDKGHYGVRIAALLGIAHSSAPTPDWRGEVELKSLAVVRASAGWRIKDGPALSMRSVDAREKLARVLWIVRVDEGEVPGSPVLCWYYQELDGELAAAFESARHLRPKGGKGTTARGWYLRRGFFDACGLMRALNGA